MPRLFGDAYSRVSDPMLRRACELAELGRGSSWPNPLVGCVIVRDGSVVGEGFHERAGGPHAEVAALQAAGEAARGAVAYVTLEPCSHQGRTPPCAPALARAGVTRVVIGMPDPNPLASGGAAFLRDAGIEVEFAGDPAPFEELNREWLHHLRTGRPFVRVKVALTLDGHATLVGGLRSELTGEAARWLTMRLRGMSDAVVVGTTTVAIDDPSLTVRDPEGRPAPRQPRRVILSRTELPDPGARLFRDGHGQATVVLPEETGPAAGLDGTDARILTYPIADGLDGAFRALGEDGVVSALVEAGPRLLGALDEAALIDEMVLYHAGGFAGPGAPPLLVAESQGDPSTLARTYRAFDAGTVGDDAVTVWRPLPAQDDIR